MELELDAMTPEMAEEALQERLQRVYADLTSMRDEWVRHRAKSGVEGRWRRAQLMFDGKDPTEADTSLESILKDGPQRRRTGRQRSRVVVNIVAPKVESAVSRLCEILLPVDDKNWGIRPTPDPELAEDMDSDQPLVNPETGTQATVGEAAKAAKKRADKACEAMSRKIEDTHVECGFNGHQRRMIWDAAKLGTGIIKGPVPFIQRSKVYKLTPGGYTRQVNEKLQPGTEWVDPWNVFFDPACGNDHQRGKGVWERKTATRKELRKLVGIPGYDATAIREVLREKPRRVRVAEGRIQREDCENDAYEMWAYSGEIDPEDFGTVAVRTGLTEDGSDDPLMVEQAVMVIVNDKVIGGLAPWWDETLPYDVFCWHKADDSPFGHGIPDRAETQQRVVNAAWRQVMDNAGHTAGPQVVVLRHLVDPQDNDWTISPFKVWVGKEDLDDARKAFAVFDFPDRLENLLTIAQTAMQFADQESNLPLLMQGDQGSAPDTVGGMTLLMNSANSPLRHRVKLFDDVVTRPHLRRYYDWFMEFDPDPSIKGDFEVDARGSTTLIERDIQNQAMLNVAQLAANPVFSPLIQQKAAPALRAILKSFKLDPDEFVPTDEEIKQAEDEAAQSPPPMDPKVEATQIQAAVKREEIADRKEERAHRAMIEQQNANERAASIAYNAQREQGEYEIAMAQIADERERFFAKIANEQKMTVEDLLAKYKIRLLELDHDRQLFNAEAQLKTQMGSGI